MGNSAITLRPYFPADAVAILGEQQRFEPAASPWQQTALYHGQPVASGGIALQWPEPGPDGYTGAAWFICKDDLPTSLKVAILLRVRTLYYAWREEFACIEMNCLARSMSHRLARICDMRWQCVRRKWLFGQDVTLYGWSRH